jgi:hypothetical protein
VTWVRTDDQMPRHPKMWRLSDAAYRLNHHGLSHCAAYATDGFIDEAYIDTLIPAGRKARQFADELVSAGVWEKVPGGWCIHDYLEYQPSAAQVEAQRRATRERVKAWRADPRNATRNGGVTS